MTSCKQLKNNFFLLLFYIKIAYFVRERFHFSIGTYISMKSKFFFLIRKLRKMVKTSKFISQKRKKKQKKLTSNNKNNKKQIRNHYSVCFFCNNKSFYCAVLSNNKLPSFKRILSIILRTL